MSNPPTKLSFSLSKPSSTKPPPPPSGFSFSLKKNGGPSSTSKQPSLSLDDEDDEPSSTGAANSIKRPSKETGTNKSLIAKSTGAISRAARKVQEEAVKVDSSVFEYDEVWDGMKAAQKDVEREKEAEALERKPKYVEAFLASASTRRLDRLRAEEKMLQHERDKEGEEFEGKEKFVTGAYKKQMEEVRKAEEEEKAREERERKERKGPGMTTFYRNMLDADEEKHAAAVAATTASKAVGTSGPSLAIRPPPSKPQYDPEPEEGAYLRREAALQAAANSSTPVVEKLPATNVIQDEVVEINDEGAIVDHRVLLKAGLNITKKPVVAIPSLSGKGGGLKEEKYQSRAVGASASYAERTARERRRLAEMMEEEGERKVRERKEKEREEEELVRRRREVGKSEEGEEKRKAARERFEERKRRKLEGAGEVEKREEK